MITLRETVYIPLRQTIREFQHSLKKSALTGHISYSPASIIRKIQEQPTYNLDTVIQEVTDALVADNETTNCITGNDTEHVVVTKEKLHQVLEIIKHGGIKHGRNQKRST